LDKEVWKTLKIGCFQLSQPLTVNNIDSTENRQGKIEYYCWIKVHYQGKMMRMPFFLTNLGRDRFILGYPFLFTFNPEVDWRKAVLKGGEVHLETVGFRWAQRRVERCQKEARKCARTLAADEEIWVQKITTAQQWAHEAQHEQGEESPHELPEEY
jgi:hypothetical protein